MQAGRDHPFADRRMDRDFRGVQQNMLMARGEKRIGVVRPIAFVPALQIAERVLDVIRFVEYELVRPAEFVKPDSAAEHGYEYGDDPPDDRPAGLRPQQHAL